MKLEQNSAFTEAAKALKLTGLKQNFGHDKRGAMGNVSIDGKKVFSLEDDGWGGGTQVTFTKDGEALLIAFSDKINLKQLILDDSKKGEFSLYDSIDDIKLHDIADNLFDYLVNQKTIEKELKKIENNKDKKVFMGKPLNYASMGWKNGMTLSKLVTLKGGLNALQKTYDELKSEMTEDDQIFNTEYLESLGVKL